MACDLFGTKPLPEPMFPYCQLDSWEHDSAIGTGIIFIQENENENAVCQNVGHFVQGEMR